MMISFYPVVPTIVKTTLETTCQEIKVSISLSIRNNLVLPLLLITNLKVRHKRDFY